MEDAIGEGVDEFDGVDALPDEMGGVEVDSKGGVVIEGGQRAIEGDDVVGDFGWVDFECESDIVF